MLPDNAAASSRMQKHDRHAAAAGVPEHDLAARQMGDRFGHDVRAGRRLTLDPPRNNAEGCDHDGEPDTAGDHHAVGHHEAQSFFSRPMERRSSVGAGTQVYPRPVSTRIFGMAADLVCRFGFAMLHRV